MFALLLEEENGAKVWKVEELVVLVLVLLLLLEKVPLLLSNAVLRDSLRAARQYDNDGRSISEEGSLEADAAAAAVVGESLRRPSPVPTLVCDSET